MARVGSVYLMLVGLAVMTHFIAVPLYHPGGDVGYPVWEVLNYLMAAAIIMALVSSGVAKWRHDRRDGEALPHIAVNLVFYSVFTVGVIFFWNWGDIRSGDDIVLGNVPVLNDLFAADSSVGNLLIWNFIDIVLPLVLIAAGRQLWQAAPVLGSASESEDGGGQGISHSAPIWQKDSGGLPGVDGVGDCHQVYWRYPLAEVGTFELPHGHLRTDCPGRGLVLEVS